MLMPFLAISAQNVTYMTKMSKMTKDQRYIACLETIHVHMSDKTLLRRRVFKKTVSKKTDKTLLPSTPVLKCNPHTNAGVLGRRVLSV